MEMFFRIYEGLDREGPGSFQCTAQAFALCRESMPPRPRILELGCGSGGATIALAQVSGGDVTATDVYKPYLDRVVQRAEQAGVADRVRVLNRDMARLDFEPESFDLIWCEGAAYIMGVDAALKYWKGFLKPGGCLVFSDAVWFTDDRPGELIGFWKEGYPAMRTAKANEEAARAAGYTVLGGFRIPDLCWEEYYADVEQRMNRVEPEYGTDPDGRAIIDATRVEIALYRKYPKTCGYQVHVLRR